MDTLSNEKAEQMIRSLGLLISNAQVYGAQHGVTQNAANACYAQLEAVWPSGDVTILLSDDSLTINGVAIEQKNPLVKGFVAHMEKLDLSNFTLRAEMTRAQFSAFQEIILAPVADLQALGGVVGAIAAVGLSDVITTRKISYVEVDEDEMVVEKGTVVSQESDDAQKQKSEQVSQYLVGRGSADDSEASASVRALAENTEDLTEAIVETATSKGEEGGDGFAKEIVAILQRVYLALTSSPTFHTQKTKKQIHKTLSQVEKALHEKLLQAHLADESAFQSIHEVIETMEDELTIDALSQEYVKRRGAISSSEKRILRFMKNKTVEMIEESDLKSRLIEGGLAPEDWHDLMVKSGALEANASPESTRGFRSAGDGGLGGADESILNLQELIHKLENDVGLGHGVTGEGKIEVGRDAASTEGQCAVMLRIPEEVLKQDVEAVQHQVNRIILHAEKRIEQLVREVEGDAADKTDRSDTPRISQQRLFEILAELGQELCQPLSVINCSVDTLMSGMIGEISDVQRKMLELSSESTNKMKVLVDKLIAIAGVPEGRNVDKAIQSSLTQ